MADKFNKIKAIEGIKTVAKINNETANLITIRYYADDDLLDYPKNNEDIENTEDLEQSIKEQGFTDPIEVTDFGMKPNKYMIVSGHRRRKAGQRCNMRSFPCIVRHFKSEAEVSNYVLFSNAQRDSSKDPLLYVRRYKLHEQYLTEINFKGSMREEIAKRLGVKPAQADRYKQMNSIIFPVWDLVREGHLGLSSVTDSGMYTHTESEQQEILKIIQECMTDRDVTRNIMKKIVVGYRDGKRTWHEIAEKDDKPIIEKPIERYDVATSIEEKINDKDHDNIITESLNFETQGNVVQAENENSEHIILPDTKNQEVIDDVIQQEPEITRGKELIVGDKICKSIDTLDGLLNECYKFENDEKVESILKTMSGLIKTMLNEMKNLSQEYNKENIFSSSLQDISIEIRLCK